MPPLTGAEARARALKKLVECGLYLVTDHKMDREQRLRAVTSALEAGARVIQLRDKVACARDLLSEARTMVKLCHAHSALLIVNDRADVAFASEADGVHLGQEDLPIQPARKMLGEAALIGISASYPHEAVEAEERGADYIGFGAMFSTPTKTDAEHAGPEVLADVKARVRIPVVGIGGITKENAIQVLRAGADALAVVSAVFGSEDPGSATKDLLYLIRRFREGPWTPVASG